MRNRLSVRRPDGSLGRAVKEQGSEQDRNARRLIILIHGYQNSEKRATKSYDRFVTNLRTAAGRGERGLGAFWDFHWPGDHVSKPFSLLTYPVRVVNARPVATLFVDDWIERLGESQRVVIVGHSLGCRVAMELAYAIRKKQEAGNYYGPQVEALFMLAAAVPMAYCRRGHDFADPIAGCTEHVFVSTRDRALKTAFETGQYAVPEPGIAVGREGLPYKRWDSCWITKLDHGDYWGSRMVAERICESLSLQAERTLEERQLAFDFPGEEPEGLDRREIPEQSPDSRSTY